MIPAIDIRGGRCVRLLRGSFEHQTVYGSDPVSIARDHAAAGAVRLHVVDLDAAAGSGDNRQAVSRIVAEAGTEVQVAGGIRGLADVFRWLDAGVAAVVMGTTAVRRPDVLQACTEAAPGRVLAALDLRAGRPAVSGWLDTEKAGLAELAERWNPMSLGGVILTVIDRDGTLAGPDLERLAEVIERFRHPVVYSGGVSSAEDVANVRLAGAAGVILGKALYEGRVTITSALAAARP